MYELLTANNGLTYGVICGNETFVFIKPGLSGSIYGYENKYLKIAERLNQKYSCTIIASPNENKTNFSAEMDFLNEYAVQHNLQNFQIYYFGFSNGALIGMSEAFKYPRIKRLLLINAPLCINMLKSIEGIRKFTGEKMTLLFGSKDPSYDLAKMFTELESEKVAVKIVPDADHNFTGALDLFISLPEKYLFGQTEKDIIE